jgi:hypothetical protein
MSDTDNDKDIIDNLEMLKSFEIINSPDTLELLQHLPEFEGEEEEGS